MIARTPDPESTYASHCGLRMAADQFLQIPDDGCFYELIDGVVMMSPSPTPKHQRITTEITGQLFVFLRDHPVGEAFAELDVHLGTGPTGGDLVYRPEVIFVRSERMTGMEDKITGAPDVVVEVISQGSRRMDTETKKTDYERFGVKEYWIIDPERKSMVFWRLDNNKFKETTAEPDQFKSEAVPGFVLDLIRIRERF